MQNQHPNFKKRIFQLFFILLSCCALIQCGFHLRGEQMIPPQMHVIYIASPNPYDPFIVQLRNSLKSFKVGVVDEPQQAPVILQILSVAFNQRLTSTSANTQVRTYDLSYEVNFQLTSPHGQIIYGPINVKASIPFYTSDTQLLGDTQQLKLKQKRMLQEIITKIFYHINSDHGRQALQQIPLTD